MKLVSLLKYAITHGASDLHITVAAPPIMRVYGELELIAWDKLTPKMTKALIYEVLTESQKRELEEKLYVGFSLSVEGVGRIRANVYHQRGSVEGCFRLVPSEVPRLEDLGLPEVVQELCRKPRGLVLITGPAGAGKTTTFNAMIDFINRERRVKIVTVEDPIEYLHSHKKGIVVQQEVGTDIPTFHEALFNILRQDPNVIGVGELRSLETIQMAMTAAETGHLVIATMHTQDAPQTIERIVDVFPPQQQTQVRIQLSMTIQGIISQILLPRIDKKGRIVASELLLGSQGVRNLIREGKIEQLPSIMQTGTNLGMITMDRSLRNLYEQGLITYATACARAKNPNEIMKK